MWLSYNTLAPSRSLLPAAMSCSWHQIALRVHPHPQPTSQVYSKDEGSQKL